MWVPESLREARVDPGRRGALILLLVAALAAVATAVGVWRDRPEVRAVDTSVVAALAISSELAPQDLAAEPGGVGPSDGAVAANGSSASAASPDTAVPGGETGSAAPPIVAEIVVSVTGLVAAPGVVTLAPGARVADAVAAAGGAAPGANLTGLNLAARLADGDSVVVGSTPAAGDLASGVTGTQSAAGPADAAAGGSSGGATGLINLNTADEAALDTLPGVGPVMAQNILAWRESNGRFSSIEQLQEISGIGPSRYAQISPLVTVS